MPPILEGVVVELFRGTEIFDGLVAFLITFIHWAHRRCIQIRSFCHVFLFLAKVGRLLMRGKMGLLGRLPTTNKEGLSHRPAFLFLFPAKYYLLCHIGGKKSASCHPRLSFNSQLYRKPRLANHRITCYLFSAALFFFFWPLCILD